MKPRDKKNALFTTRHINKNIMKKTIIEVPLHVNFINQWNEFRNLLPKGQIVLNKVFPGCGMTTYFLESVEPIILASPRKKLLENKTEKMHKECKSYFYYQASTKKRAGERQTENEKTFKELSEYITNSYIYNYTPKILVTYDSLPSLYKKLLSIGFSATLVVDEFHVAFIDYDMKRDVIERFFSVTRIIPNVIYLSATPIMEQYLEQMEVFKDLPYVELSWHPSKIKKPQWTYKNMKSTIDAASSVIQRYKTYKRFDTITYNGISYESVEAVFFINDVRNIAQIIKRNGLSPQEVNIIIAEGPENKATITKVLGNEFTFGRIPLEGESHKTYTFCSKTAFFGCDFCSTNASTYVFADANLKNMCNDIALDLPQIAGRQRLEGINLFKDRITIFVKYCCASDIEDYENHKARQADGEKLSEQVCEEWARLSQIALASINVNTSMCPYGVIYQDPSRNDEWVVKKSVNAMIAEDRAWELRNCIYKDRQTFSFLMKDNGFDIVEDDPLPYELSNFYRDFMQSRNFSDQLKMFCDFFDCHPEFIGLVDKLMNIAPEFKNYYFTFGSAYLAQKAYKQSRIKPEYDAFVQQKVLRDTIMMYFDVSQKYTKRVTKTKLQLIYNSIGLQNKISKATDILNYFEVKDCTITVDGVRQPAFLLTNIK